MTDETDRDRMSELLGDIVRHEADHDRPLLTVIVVHRGNDNNPREGFFAIATELRRFNGSRDALARLELGVRQLQEVHAYWATP